MRALNFADRVRPMTLNSASVPTMACDLGYMSREGLDAKIIQCDSTPQALALLMKGDVQMAQVNIPPVIEAVAKGDRLRVVWASVHGDPLKAAAASSSPDAGLMLVASPSLSKVDQLRGARIGISGKGATNHLAVVSLLREHKIDPEAGVRWVEGGTPIDRVNKLIGGEIDAMVTTSQTLALFPSKRDSFRVLASGRDFNKAGAIAFLVAATTEELVLAEPQTVLSAVKALIKASRDLSQDKQRWTEAAAKRRPDVPREAIEKGWEQSRGHWPVNGRLDPRTVESAAKTLRRSGQVSTVPSAPGEEWVDMRFVDGALKELGEWH